MTDINRILAVLGTVALLAGCGQYGQLYLPDKGGEVVTRPTQTPPEETGETANSPQSVDSPSAPASPAPEVTEPEDGKKKERKDGASNPPPPEKNN